MPWPKSAQGNPGGGKRGWAAGKGRGKGFQGKRRGIGGRKGTISGARPSGRRSL